MRSPPALRILLTALLSSTTTAIQTTYDTGYSLPTRSLSEVSCSNGSNGLLSRFPTQANLPRFPYIGGAFTIAEWNDVHCGGCYNLTYVEGGRSVFVLAIDHAEVGFNVAVEVLDDLTSGRAVEVGMIDVVWEEVEAPYCGL